jgi:hypothetical protein
VVKGAHRHRRQCGKGCGSIDARGTGGWSDLKGVGNAPGQDIVERFGVIFAAK